MGSTALKTSTALGSKTAEMDRLQRELHGRLELESMFPAVVGRGRIQRHYLAIAYDMTELRSSMAVSGRVSRRILERVTIVIEEAATKERIICMPLSECAPEVQAYAVAGLTKCSRDKAMQAVQRIRN